MWIEFFQQTISEDKFKEFIFNSPIAPEFVVKAETELGILLPDDLKSRFAESNGISHRYGRFLLSLSELVKENQNFRSSEPFKELYMSFENLLFFGDAGNGDLFAYKVLKGRSSNIDIFVWDHEDDSRTFIAGSLKNFLEYWLTGKLKI